MLRSFHLVTTLFFAQAAAAEDWAGKSVKIPDMIWGEMKGVSWHEDLDCPERSDLRLLLVPYLNFDGLRQEGQMIVSEGVADEVLEVFKKIAEEGFQVQRMELVYNYDGDDDQSMASNNTSAFNCRLKTSGTSLSEHSYGKAIDINPIQNPYVTSSVTIPPAGGYFDEPEERDHDHVGMIRAGDIVTRAFDDQGWKWGGNWNSIKDYQHFSTSGG